MSTKTGVLREDFYDFLLGMEIALRRKDEEYKDLWKTCDLQVLENHLLEEIQEWLDTKDHKELIDIANCCAMLYTRMREEQFSKINLPDDRR